MVVRCGRCHICHNVALENIKLTCDHLSPRPWCTPITLPDMEGEAE